MRSAVILSVLGFLSFFVTLSSLSLYVVGRGTPTALAGLGITVMLVATVLCQLSVPMLLRRWGTGLVMSVGLITLGVPTPALLLGSGLAPILAVSAVRGLGFAILTVTLPLIITGTTPKERHGAAIGVYGLAIAVPQLVMVPLGVALTRSGHFGWVAWLGLAPVLALPFVRGLSAGGPVEPESETTAARKLPRSRRIPGLVSITAVLLTSTLAGGGVLTILPVYRPGFSATWALVAFGVTAALVRWQIGLVADRRGPGGLLPLGIGLNILGLGMIAAGTALTGAAGDVMVIGGALVFGAGYGAVQNLTLLIGFAIAGARRATASAIWNAAFDLGTAIGALLVGAVTAWTSLPVAVVVCIVLIAATALPGHRIAQRAGTAAERSG